MALSWVGLMLSLPTAFAQKPKPPEPAAAEEDLPMVKGPTDQPALPIQRPKGVEESVLYSVLSILVRENDSSRHRVGPPMMQANQLGKRRFAALLRSDDVIALGHTFRCVRTHRQRPLRSQRDRGGHSLPKQLSCCKYAPVLGFVGGRVVVNA